jgi:FxLD family lantipeptide
MNTTAPSITGASQSEFDLDVSIVESVPVDGDLMRSTDDNCTTTSDSACVTCFHG